MPRQVQQLPNALGGRGGVLRRRAVATLTLQGLWHVCIDGPGTVSALSDHRRTVHDLEAVPVWVLAKEVAAAV